MVSIPASYILCVCMLFSQGVLGLDDAVISPICAIPSCSSALCNVVGAADQSCQAIATSVSATDATCSDKNICSFTLPSTQCRVAVAKKSSLPESISSLLASNSSTSSSGSDTNSTVVNKCESNGLVVVSGDLSKISQKSGGQNYRSGLGDQNSTDTNTSNTSKTFAPGNDGSAATTTCLTTDPSNNNDSTTTSAPGQGGTGSTTTSAPGQGGTGSTTTSAPGQDGTGSTTTSAPGQGGTGSTTTHAPGGDGSATTTCITTDPSNINGTTTTYAPGQGGTGSTTTYAPGQGATGSTTTSAPGQEGTGSTTTSAPGQGGTGSTTTSAPGSNDNGSSTTSKIGYRNGSPAKHGSTGGSSLDSSAEAKLCEIPKPASLCTQVGEADDACQSIASSIGATASKCYEVGACEVTYNGKVVTVTINEVSKTSKTICDCNGLTAFCGTNPSQ